jgi:hypothetical protein
LFGGGVIEALLNVSEALTGLTPSHAQKSVKLRARLVIYIGYYRPEVTTAGNLA